MLIIDKHTCTPARSHPKAYICALMCTFNVHVYARMNMRLTHALQEQIMSLDLASQHLVFATPSGEVGRA